MGTLIRLLITTISGAIASAGLSAQELSSSNAVAKPLRISLPDIEHQAASISHEPSTPPKLVPLQIKLPAPRMGRGPVDLGNVEHVEPLSPRPRPPLMVPPGVTNLSANAGIHSSDPSAPPSALQDLLKERTESDEEEIILKPGLQWVQISLTQTSSIYAVVIWHTAQIGMITHDVIVQIADDDKFQQNVRTVFNNDFDNSAGFGRGTDREYFETHEGKLVALEGMRAKSVRLYSSGTTMGQRNPYFRIDLHGLPNGR